MDKKKAIGIVVTAAICLVVVCIIVFGNIKIQNTDENTASSPDSSTEASTEKPTTVTLEQYISQVTDYINSNGGMDDNYTKGSIYADAEGMVYDYTLKQQNAGADFERVKQTVDALFEQNDSRYWDAVYELQDSTGKDYRLLVVYHNADGSVIGEREYQ